MCTFVEYELATLIVTISRNLLIVLCVSTIQALIWFESHYYEQNPVAPHHGMWVNEATCMTMLSESDIEVARISCTVEARCAIKRLNVATNECDRK